MSGRATRWTGAGRLMGSAARRDRLGISVSVLVLVAVCYTSAAATRSLYPTGEARVSAATAIDASRALVGLYGPILDVHSLGELSMTKLTVLYAVFVALLTVLIVRRHTRTEEEAGRAELLGGTPIGRDAPLLAAVGLGAAVSVGVGLLAGLADVAGGLPLVGSVAFGTSWAGVGLVGSGLAAACCQLSASSRTCASITAVAIGALFVVRAVGDAAAPWLSWASPFGWATQVRAWSHPRGWVLLLYVATFIALVGLAQALRGSRDLGVGMFAARPGPASGSSRLSGVLALEVRLHRNLLLTWTFAMGTLGALLGAVDPTIGSVLDSPSARGLVERVGGRGSLEDSLLAAELSIVAVAVTCYAITVVAHGGDDERGARTDQVLATATSRSRTFVATLIVAVVGATWLLGITGVAISLGHRGASGSVVFERIVPAALAQAPAVWSVAALAVAAYALRSDRAPLGWALLVFFLTVGQLGELAGLPRWVVDLSPYAHVPQLPVESHAAGASVILVALTVALLVGSWFRYRTRDIG